jgi:mannose/fructose/N-acetylgalactosamine-specific phosphotransferase system component IIB
MIVLSRIDDRLIHGQVVEGWVTFLKATCILVADDIVASNVLQRSIMELAVPEGLKVSIGGVEEICKQLLSKALDTERVILLFSNPAAVLSAIRAGLKCPSVNIGGMHYIPGKRKLLNTLAVDDADLTALREIVSQGIQVAVQAVPTQRPMRLDAIFTACHMSK